MALGQLAPWLNINTQEWGNLAARGAQLDIERQRLADEVQQRKAASALQRDRFQLDTQNAQTRNDQLAAGMALRLAQMKQAGLMGQEKLGQGQERIDQSGQSAAAKLAEITNRDANTNQNQQDRNQIAADAVDLRKQIEVAKNDKAVSTPDKFNLDRLGKSMDVAWTAFSKGDTNAPAQLKILQESADKILANYPNKSAASTLTQGTGTNPPAPAPAPTQPAAAALTGTQPASPSTGAVQFKTADDVKAAYKAGKIDKQSALQVLQDQFGMQ
jgi:hypothetical protein